MTSFPQCHRYGLLLLLAWMACAACASPSDGQTAIAPAARAAASPAQAALIDHVAPEPNSVGPPPTRFEWTAAKGADRYSIGVWSEVDVLVWRQDNVRATAIERPADVVLAPGTYFWSVTAWRGDTTVAESGRAAFVVRQ